MTARRLLILAVVAVMALTVVGVGTVTVRRLAGSGPEFVRRGTNPAPVVPVMMAEGPVRVVGAPEPVTGEEVELTIDLPADAEAMQIGYDPGFVFDEWRPIATTATVPVYDQGYQILYIRFRSGDGAVSAVHPVGFEADRNRPAALTGGDGRPHRPVWVRPLSANELVVRVEAGRVVRGGLEIVDIDDPPEGLASTRGLIGTRRVTENGETYGWPVSGRSDIIRRADRLEGSPFDGSAASVGTWTVSSADDPAFGAGGVEVDLVQYRNRPVGGASNQDDVRLWAGVHDLVLDVRSPLRPGAVYRVEGPSDLVEPIEFRFEPDRTVSPSVQVNQVGYGPTDAKVAFFAGWPGTGSASAAGTPEFRLIDADTGAAVFTGAAVELPGGDEMDRGDLTGATVHELDFSELERPGRYRVCVASVGCSYDFDIGSSPWHDVTTSVAKAMYLQRSGLELGPPHIPFTRPRPYHPADGAVVVESSTTLMETNAGVGFGAVVGGARIDEVPEAWGGHFDAGDWDRRIQHLWYARAVAQLLDAHGDRLASLELNIPESGDGVPDLLDEALWSLDFYRRLQTDDGGIRGGVEASEHPPPHSTSWTDDLAVYALDPDPWSSYVYGSVAAEVSVALAPYDGARADRYLTSARAAIDWADRQEWQDDPRWDDAQRAATRGQRNVAAAAMLYATGETEWHQVFEQTAESFGEAAAGDGLMSCHVHTRCDASWLYLRTAPALTDPQHRAALERSFVDSADQLLAAAETTTYGFTTENPFVPLIWGLGSGGAPHGSGLIKAYLLTGDERYRDGLVRSASVALGANPTNSVLVTGHGQEPARHPLIVDSIHGALPVWPGTPLYGRHMLNAEDDDTWVVDSFLTPAGAAPSPLDEPYMWQWYDVVNAAFFTEFTVHQSHTEALLTFATLAATS